MRATAAPQSVRAAAAALLVCYTTLAAPSARRSAIRPIRHYFGVFRSALVDKWPVPDAGRASARAPWLLGGWPSSAQRSARESFERARRRLARREELMRTYGSLWHVFQRLEETSWASPSDVEWSDDDSSCDESRCDEQALSPTAVFHEYFYPRSLKDL